jgi:four helix bundle protein
MTNYELRITKQGVGDGNSVASTGEVPRATSPRDIEERTFLFAARILRMARKMPRDISGQVVARQVARSGTSVGANVEEAQGAQSRVEFARRMSIARSEARETKYWLRLIAETEQVKPLLMKSLVQESDELIRILTTITKKTRKA